MTSDYIFVDEAGDPGIPFTLDNLGNRVPTGSSLFYIITALCLDEKKLFMLEKRVMETKNRFGYTKEIKSNEVSLGLYKELLKILDLFQKSYNS